LPTKGPVGPKIGTKWPIWTEQNTDLDGHFYASEIGKKRRLCNAREDYRKPLILSQSGVSKWIEIH
jgi:hypothetical protein